MKTLFTVLACLIAGPAYSAQTTLLVQTAVNVTTSTTVVTSRASRAVLILVNDSDATIYCNIAGGSAVLNQGIRLNSGGGSMVLDVVTPTGAVACIHGGTGNKAMLVTEG